MNAMQRSSRLSPQSIVRFFKENIRARLVLFTSIAAFLAILILSFIASEIATGIVKANRGKLLEEISFQLNRETSIWLVERFHEIENLSSLSVFRQPNKNVEEIRTLFSVLQTNNPAYTWIGVADAKGIIQVNTLKLLNGKDISQRPIFSETMKGVFIGTVHDAVVLTNLLPNENGEPLRLMDLGIPVKDAQGNIVSVLAAHLNWEFIRNLQKSLENRLDRTADVEVMIVAPNNEVLSEARKGKEEFRKIESLKALELARKGERSYSMEQWADGRYYLTGFSSLEGHPQLEKFGWVVLVREPMESAFAPARFIGNSILVVGLFSSFMLIGLLWLLIGQVTKPLIAIAQSANQSERTDGSSVDFPLVSGTDEVGTLSKSLRAMVYRLRQKNQELVESKKVAESANQAKSQFLANISHEIRTPLGIILGYAEILEDPKSTQDIRTDAVKKILNNGRLLTRIISEVLDVSKIEAKKLEVESISFDLRKLVDELQSAMMLKAKEKDLQLEIEVSPEVPPFIDSDPTRIKQILTNLLTNAIKFTQKGFVRLEVKTHFNQGQNSVLTFLVRDSGIGLTQEQSERLFQPFSQADASMTRKFGGTGLGLFLSRELAEAMKGELFLLESSLKKGSVFCLKLPVTVADKKSEPPSVHNEQKNQLQGLNILVVDDSVDNRLLVGLHLRKQGAQVVEAENGAEGVQLALKNPFDAILMDIQMPVMDGYTALHELKKTGYDKPIIALTAHVLKEEQDKALGYGFNAYLGKPMDKKLVTETIHRLSRDI